MTPDEWSRVARRLKGLGFIPDDDSRTLYTRDALHYSRGFRRCNWIPVVIVGYSAHKGHAVLTVITDRYQSAGTTTRYTDGADLLAHVAAVVRASRVKGRLPGWWHSAKDAA
jgi:hypothetical protein